MQTPSPIPLYIKGTFILLGLCLGILIMYLGTDVFVPLLFSLFIAILLNPLVNLLNRKKVPRVLSITIALVLGFIVIGALCALLVIQIQMCAQDTDLLTQKFNQLGSQFLSWCSSTFHVSTKAVKEWFVNMESETGKSFLQGFGGTLMTFGSLAVTIFVIPVYVFLLLYYKPLLLEFIARVFERKQHKTVSDVLLSINSILKNYLFGLIIETVIVAVLNSVGLLLIGVKYAILLGITGALLNLIPYIGGIVAVLLSMVVALLTKSPLAAGLVLVLYSVIQFVDNHYLVPYIVASRVKINAIICIVAVIVGGLVWGVSGMFLSIPLTALLKVVCDHIEELKPYGFLLGDTMPETLNPSFFKWLGKSKQAEQKP